MTAPVRVDTVTFTDATDFDALAHQVLRGDGGFGAYPSDNAPVDWVFRAYDQVLGTPFAGRLSAGVAACLTCAEPEVRAQALLFFQTWPHAAGCERILDLLTGDRRLFAGIPDPLHTGVDLEWQLLAALAAGLGRAGLGRADQRAAELARAEALRPGKAQPVIGALASTAPDWVLAHAEDIVRATAEAGITILITLQDGGRDLVRHAARIAPLCRRDPRFEDYVSRFIDDPATRQAILDTFRSTVRTESRPR
jgi:hypothetical protein